MIRLLIVGDLPAVRKGLRMLLSAEVDLSVIGEAPDGEAALHLAAALHPDIVLMDIDMPRLDGIATASSLRLICPQAGVIVLSMHDDALTRARAHEAGAVAFVDKSMPADTLPATIREIAHSPLGNRSSQRHL